MADPAALQATVSQWVTLGPELALRLQSRLGKPRAADPAQGRAGVGGANAARPPFQLHHSRKSLHSVPDLQ